MLLNQQIEFKNVKGVGDVKLQLSDKKMNVIIGANGVGKTKTLEALYTALLFTNQDFAEIQHITLLGFLVFTQGYINNKEVFLRDEESFNSVSEIINSDLYHKSPVVYLAAQSRGEIKSEVKDIKPIGTYLERKKEYFSSIVNGMRKSFSSLNMSSSIDEWFIQRAYSANPYQSKEDNREVEIVSVLRILNQIDPRISSNKEDLEIEGGNRVIIKLDGKKRYLNELSSGFASLIKIVQSIVAGYSFFTNAEEIEQVEGYVLIDEVESHLHIEWQTKILPLLTKIFPNTYFVITTHSSLVLTQLVDGVAYQLVREGSTVFTKPILNAGQSALIDLLEDAFGVNLNKLRIENTTAESQADVKKALLDLLGA